MKNFEFRPPNNGGCLQRLSGFTKEENRKGRGEKVKENKLQWEQRGGGSKVLTVKS